MKTDGDGIRIFSTPNRSLRVQSTYYRRRIFNAGGYIQSINTPKKPHIVPKSSGLYRRGNRGGDMLLHFALFPAVIGYDVNKKRISILNSSGSSFHFEFIDSISPKRWPNSVEVRVVSKSRKDAWKNG